MGLIQNAADDAKGGLKAMFKKKEKAVEQVKEPPNIEPEVPVPPVELTDPHHLIMQNQQTIYNKLVETDKKLDWIIVKINLNL